MMNMKNKSLILLSGGLDSLVCLGAFKDEYNINSALFFDYGQLSLKYELSATKKISEFYNIGLEIINLKWLENLCSNSTLIDKKEKTVKENDNVWIPNRNGLFLNIAGCYAEARNFSSIIIGANVQESKEFPDNSENFIDSVNNEFLYSTKSSVKVVAPLIKYDKNQIVKFALEQNIPLNLVRSCYSSTKYHCGVCKSCVGLKNALEYNRDNHYIKVLFK